MDFINLPQDVLLHNILLFVPKYDLRLTNKEYWHEGYKVKLSSDLLMERAYYRFLIRKNLYFVFDVYINYFINITNAINVKNHKTKYHYKNMIFSNRLDELIYFSKNYKIKNRCGEIIHKNKDKIKKKFKKTRKKNVRWTN